jgi:hypothetical protein
VRRPRDSLRKDWGDTTRVYLVGYSETPLGYRVYIPELRTEMTSVHCIFDEMIPDRESEFFEQIDQMYTDVETQNAQQEDFEYLIGTRHVDDEDGLEYVVTRVGKLRGDVVAWRAPWLNGHEGHEESVSLNVADVARMTAATMGTSVCRQAGIPAERVDWGQSETSGSSAVPIAAKSRRSKYQSMSGTAGNTTRSNTSSERGAPLDVGEDERGVGTSDKRPGKRVRRQNVVTNASSFEDIGYAAVG